MALELRRSGLPAHFRPPELTKKVVKAVASFLKSHSFAAALQERGNDRTEAVLGESYGVQFYSTDKDAPSFDYAKSSAADLLGAVESLKSGGCSHATLRGAFAVAHMMMERGSYFSHSGGRKLEPEPEFNAAQAILMQIVAALPVDGVSPNSFLALDGQRAISICHWQARVLALPVYLDGRIEPREYAVFPKPDTSFYRETLSVISCLVQGENGYEEVLFEGAHVVISFVHPHVDLKHDISPGADAARKLLKFFLPSPSEDDVCRYLRAADEKRPVVFLRRNLGLTHPDLPFHESNNVVFLAEDMDVLQVMELSNQIPCGLNPFCLDCQHGIVPFTFPPAVDDWDARIQSSMLALGAPFGGLEEAVNYFHDMLEEQQVNLGEVGPEAVSDLDVDAGDELIAHAKRLARDALLCLQRHHAAIGWVSELVEEMLEAAAYQLRIRSEQDEVSKRWSAAPEQPRKNRHAAKRERKRLQGKGEEATVEANPGMKSATQRLQGILSSFHNKIFKYAHYVRAFSAMRSTGLLDHIGSEQVHGSHHVLHAAGAESVTVVRPHGSAAEHSRHRFTRSLMGIAAAAAHSSAAT